MEKIIVGVPNCKARFEEWIKNRGGVRVWRDMSIPNTGDGDVFTPANDENGGRYPKPNWSVTCGEEVITDINQFRFVKEWKEVGRFRIAIQGKEKGRSFKCTDASSAKIHKWCDKFPGSKYRFDFGTKEAVIEVPVWETETPDQKEQEPTTPLLRLLKKNPWLINGHLHGKILGPDVKGIIM